MARILILGAGRGQVELIKAAKKYGHTPIVATIPGDYPGLAYGDETVYVDISDPMQVDRVVGEGSFDAVCTCCFDTAMASLGHVCEKYGFIGVSRKAGEAAKDKLLMKERMIDGGVTTPRHLKVSCRDDLAAIAGTLRFPVVLKPVDQQGSLGVSIAETPEELPAAFDHAMANTRNCCCLAEEYIDGQKHGANGCVANGEILFLLPSEDITDTVSVLGHVFPFKVEESLYCEIIEQCTRALRAVGFDNCIFNVDYIVKDERIYILEITGRMGANGIPQLLSVYYSMDVNKLLLDLCLGENLDDYRFGNDYAGIPCCSKMLVSSQSGILKEVRDRNTDHESLVECTYFVLPGEKVNAYASAKDCVGQLIVKAETVEQCREKMRWIEQNISLILEE